MAKTNGSIVRQVVFTRAVTPSDSADLPAGQTRSLLVAEEGDVAVTYGDGSTDTVFLAAGIFHPLQVIRVRSTGTTATGIKAAY